MMQPSVNFDFTTSVLDARINFSRSLNTATRINASGFIEQINADLARFDFNPVTLACRGLLIEDQRTNSLLRSNAFSTSPWSIAGSGGSPAAILSASAGTSPDGTNNAWKLIAGTGAGTHYIQQTIGAYTSGTFSLYAKAAEKSVVRLAMFNSGTVASFDLSNGTSSGSGTRTITPVGGGWYRCTVYNAGSSNTLIQVYTGDNLAGNGTDGVLIYGAQFENGGAYSTSYIPTTNATVTRNADVATITGANFSDWWQASKGGVLVRARPGTVSGVRPWLQFDDGTDNEIIALRGNTTNPELYIVDGGVAQAQIDAGTIAANTDYSLTGWWATNDCKARLDSGAVVTDTSATIPTVTQARLGSDGTNYLNGHLASISYYDSFSEQIYTRRKNKAVFNLM